MALEEAAVLDLIKSVARLEYKVDCLMQEDKKEEEEDESELEDDDPMNWRNLLGADSGLILSGGSSSAMADSSYDSSTGTYDGLPRTGAYNGGYGL